jgi:hypothetical protein
MHDLCLTPLAAAPDASTGNQPDIDVPTTPAAESLKKSRRDKPFEEVQLLITSPQIFGVRWLDTALAVWFFHQSSRHYSFRSRSAEAVSGHRTQNQING